MSFQIQWKSSSYTDISFRCSFFVEALYFIIVGLITLWARLMYKLSKSVWWAPVQCSCAGMCCLVVCVCVCVCTPRIQTGPLLIEFFTFSHVVFFTSSTYFLISSCIEVDKANNNRNKIHTHAHMTIHFRIELNWMELSRSGFSGALSSRVWMCAMGLIDQACL